MYSKELSLAKNIAKEAAHAIHENFTFNAEVEWKSDESPLTKTDIAINAMVIEKIGKVFPDHAVLGEEESTKDIKKSEYVWVCDPIDGTFAFSHGSRTSTFSLALCKNGNPVVAVVADPYFNDLYYTSLGGGSFRNSDKIKVSSATNFNNQGVEIAVNNYEVGDYIKQLKSDSVFMTCHYSFVYGSKLVSSGHYAGSVFRWEKPWDCAAVKLLIEEAGGKTSDLEGNNQRYDRPINGFIGSNGLVHDELVKAARTVLL